MNSASEALLELRQLVFDAICLRLRLRSAPLGLGGAPRLGGGVSGLGDGALGRELAGRLRGRIRFRLVAQIEQLEACAAAILALLVADDIDEEHPVVVADFDLVEPSAALAI